MLPYKRLLVGVALNGRDKSLLAYTAAFAAAAGTREIIFAHVPEFFALPRSMQKVCAPVMDPHDSCMSDRLEAQVKRLFPSRANRKIRLETPEGTPLLELLRLAREREVDAVVVGQRRGQDKSPLAEKLTRKAPCPVLVVPAGVVPRLHRILVPSDFSAPSAEAVKTALGLAAAAQARPVELVHAFSIPAAYTQAHLEPSAWQSALLQQARRDYAHFVRQHRLPSKRLKADFKVVSRPAAAIHALAKTRRADLLVVSARGRSDLADLLMGSLVEALLRRIDRPLLAVRRKGSNRTLLDALLRG